MWTCIVILGCLPFYAKSVTDRDGSALSVLLISPHMPGHVIPFLALGEELVRRGHNVTLVSAPTDFVRKRVDSLNISLWSVGESFISAQEVAKETLKLGGSIIDKIQQMVDISTTFQKLVLEVTDNPSVKAFDIIVGDAPFSTCLFCFSRKWNIPSINVWVSLLFSPVDFFPWAFPTLASGYTEDLTFYQRLVSTVSLKVSVFFMERSLPSAFKFAEDLCHDANTTIDKIPNFIAHNPQIVGTSFGFEFSRVSLPLTHYVGPIIAQSQPEIPTDMAEWLSKRGTRSVVYVSMGSMAELTADEAEKIVNGATEANLSVLWSLRERNQHILQDMTYDTDNVLVANWTPQLSVLRHPSMHSAVLHGGLGGIQEALSCGVPVIAMPAFAEQLDNAIRLQYHHYGLMVQKRKLTAALITQSLKQFDSELYQASLKRIQKIFRKDGGVTSAADLIEFYSEVGYNHLIPSYIKYNWSWIAYNSVDVYTVLLLAVLITSYVVYRLIRCCFSALFMSKKKTE